jgi:hypothetical protein
MSQTNGVIVTSSWSYIMDKINFLRDFGPRNELASNQPASNLTLYMLYRYLVVPYARLNIIQTEINLFVRRFYYVIIFRESSLWSSSKKKVLFYTFRRSIILLIAKWNGHYVIINFWTHKIIRNRQQTLSIEPFLLKYTKKETVIHWVFLIQQMEPHCQIGPKIGPK